MTCQDDTGVEGVAVEKNPGQKTIKVGKRLASSKIKQEHHETREEANEAMEANASNLKVDAVDQA